MARLAFAIQNIMFKFDVLRFTKINTAIIQDVEIFVGTRRRAEVRSIVPFISMRVGTAW